jgi:hypothetical protein
MILAQRRGGAKIGENRGRFFVTNEFHFDFFASGVSPSIFSNVLKLPFRR